MFRNILPPQQPKCGLRHGVQIISPCWRCTLSTSARSLARLKSFVPRQSGKAAPGHSKPSTIAVPRTPAAYESLKGQLALRSSPTLLYRASSYKNYIVASYVAGVFFTSVGAFNARTPTFATGGGVPAYVPVFAAVGGFMIICAGCWMLLKPQNIVQRISSVPASSKSRMLLLRIERAPFVPFIRPKMIEVPASDVTLAMPAFNSDNGQKVKIVLNEIEHQEERDYAYSKSNILTYPFRQIAYWMWRGFVGTRRAFTSEGFNYLHIRGYGRTWKFDREAAWALDDGKALDKLVRIKMA